MGDRLPSVRAAVVQAAPVFLDREATVEKACALIEDAARLGADVTVFPEGFIPAHPVWYHFLPASQTRAVRLSTRLFENSVVVGGAETDALGAAARRAGTWVIMGICEKLAGTTGTMWNSIVYFSPEGEIARVHRKVAPTTVERLVHAGGDGEGLRAVDTSFGPLTGLLCGENSNPLLVFSALAQSSVIHAAMWPHHFSKKSGPALSMPEVILNNAQSLAYQVGGYILSCGGTLDENAKETIAESDEDRAWLAARTDFGGSCIVAPSGRVLAGPLQGEEGILATDLDLSAVVPKKLMHDYAGHYTRPDLFSVSLAGGPDPLFSPPWSTSEASPAAMKGGPDVIGRVQAEPAALPTSAQSAPTEAGHATADEGSGPAGEERPRR